MRKKILICSMILMLVCSSLSLGSISNNPIDPAIHKIKNKTLEQVPIWPVGTEWIYDVYLDYDSDDGYNDLSLNIDINNLKCEVIDDLELYHLKITGPLRGSILYESEGLPRINIDLKETEIDGNIMVEKENLSIKEISLTIDGRITIKRIPITLNLEVIANATPAFRPIQFPLAVGDAWDLNSTFFDIASTIQLPGIATLIPLLEDEYEFDFGINIASRDVVCSERVNISTPAGIFPAYNITYDDEYFLFYSPVVGNIISFSIPPSETDYIDYSLFFALQETNFVMPGAPNTPNAPTGQTQGKPNEEYEYTAVTTDPEDDQIYYLFDWGDGTLSPWIGPVDSGESITVTKTYEERGNYNIYVKAKDDDGNQSPWSDPLQVSMPKSKENRFLSHLGEWIELHFPQIFSLLDLLSDMVFS